MIELQDCQNSSSLVSSSAIFKENYNLEPKNTKYTEVFLSRSNSSLELKDHINKFNKKATSPLFSKKNNLFCNNDVNQKQKDISVNYSESFQIIREQFENSSSVTINKNNSNKNEVSSPKLRLKFNRFWKQNNLFDESLSSTDLMSSSVTSSTNMTNSSYLNVHVNNTSIVSVSADMEERQRRRAFCHYDCQSLTANLSYAAKLRGVLLARRRNTTTGASAASIALPNVRSNSPETDNQCLEEDYGDGFSNDLIENCPYFRNEIGGEEERVVSLTRIHNSNKPPIDCYAKKFIHKPLLAYGMSILEYGSGETHWRHATCPYQRLPLPIENTDRGALYYRHYFYGQEHTNWFGIDEQLGPIAISVKREKLNTSIDSNQNIHNYQYQYRLIIRTSELATLRGAILEDAIPNLRQSHSNHGSNNQKATYTKEILEFIAPEVQLNCLKLAMHTQQTENQILKLDEQGLTNQYKVGVMYCKSGQSTEEEMYNNEESGPAFLEFLDTIGQRVRLKGFDKYKAGLDTKTDSTGLYSIYAQYQDCEIMFHVSTLLPFMPNNRQQLLRKRHIGNDIVTIVFQESDCLPFTPKSIRSHFQHVFIIVRAINPCTENTHYKIAVSRSKEVPVFGPPIKEGAIFPKSKTFADFLLAKIINAENATHQSEKFVTMAIRTRHEYLKDLSLHYSTNTVLDFGQKFSIFSSKKKEKIRPPFISDNIQKGAICWQVVLDDSGQSTMVECFLGISSDTLVLIEECSRQIIFVTPCKAILGWYALTNSLRIYHHQGECCTIHMRDSSADRDELMEIIDRLKAVTKGCAVQELSLKRNFMGQLGFHVQPDGIVTQVENTGQAWQAGLRAGARIVEICKIAVSTLTHDQMVDLLKTSLLVTITVVPPLSGSITPRRGCTLHNCMFNSSFDNDYDLNQNLLETANETSSIVDKKAAQLQQPVANKNRKQLCERGFSPPRSSSSSGYGTGNSNKSFHSHAPPVHGLHQNQHFNNSLTDSRSNQTNNDGTMTSSSSDHSSDDRWYDILESHTELMANSTNDLTNTILPPADSLVTSSYLHQKQSMLSSKNTEPFNNSGKFPKSQNSLLISNNDTQTTKLLTKTSSSNKHNQNEVKLRANSNSNRTINGNLSNRNSTNISMNNTIQEDLRKLINVENNDINTTTKLKDIIISSTAQFSPLAHSSSTGNLLNTFSKSALIANRCRSRDALNNALSLNNQSSFTTKRSLSNFAPDELNFDSANNSLWSSNDIVNLTKKLSFSQATDSIVTTATVSSSQSNQKEFFDSLPPDSSITSFNSNASVPELQNHLTELESRMNMETKRRLSLENEVKRLRDENRRLQDESQTAAHQLRKFTEWFFQTIDRQ